MEEIHNATLELIESIRGLSIAVVLKEDIIKDVALVEELLSDENSKKNNIQQLIAGLNGSMIAFLDLHRVMKPYAKWKMAVGLELFK